MKLVNQSTVNNHDVKVYNDKGHYIVNVDNEFFGSAEDKEELEEILDEISKIDK